ncbi:MAG TPA: hypothetical protein VK338_00875 [Candidatus Nitrosocosmicus sp.]|nr:hypothetical protein [Candidatus Nitrosocosmicus sp.]
MIRPELREKFNKLYKEKFNIDLTEEEATEMFGDFINLMKVVLKPDLEAKEPEIYQERREHETI